MRRRVQVRASSSSGAAAAPRTLSYNPAENAVLVSSDADGGSYQLYMVPKDGRSDPSPVRRLAELSECGLGTPHCRMRQQPAADITPGGLTLFSHIAPALPAACVESRQPVVRDVF